MRVRPQLGPLARAEVGEEHPAVLREALQQHHPRRRAAVGGDRGDHHRVGFVDLGGDRVVVPPLEHRERVGGQVALAQPAVGVLAAQVGVGVTHVSIQPRATRAVPRPDPHVRGCDREAESVGGSRTTKESHEPAAAGGPRGPRGCGRVRDRDRRAGQGRVVAALPRRRHRGARRPRPVREGLGPADRRRVRARPASRRALHDPDPHRRRPRRRPGRRGHARADARHAADLRHLRRAGPARPVARRGHGAVVRRAGRPRARAADRPAAGGRPGSHPRRAVPDPVEGRAGSQARQGDRRLLDPPRPSTA